VHHRLRDNIGSAVGFVVVDVVAAADDFECGVAVAAPVLAFAVAVAAKDVVAPAVAVTAVAVNEEVFAVNHFVASSAAVAAAEFSDRLVAAAEFAAAFGKRLAVYDFVALDHDH